MSRLLEVKDLCFSVITRNPVTGQKERKQILDKISFHVVKGKITGITGESGSGKTSLAKIICGINDNYQGSFKINAEWNRKSSPVQILFQNNSEVLNPFRKIGSMIEEALILGGCGKDNLMKERNALLDSVGLSSEFASRRGYELSGGEHQRAALARLLAVKPALLVLDEPFSAQDPDSQYNLAALLKQINSDSGLTMLCISHNLNLLKGLADDVIVMYQGRIVENGKSEKVFQQPDHPYTQYLIKAAGYKLAEDELYFRDE